MQLVVGRIGRAHGIRGDVFVEVRTDEPELRFAAGSVLATDPAEVGPLTVGRATSMNCASCVLSASKWRMRRKILSRVGSARAFTRVAMSSAAAPRRS